MPWIKDADLSLGLSFNKEYHEPPSRQDSNSSPGF